MAAAARVCKELRDYVGRWGLGQHQSNEYVLSSQQIVREVQEIVLRYLCGGSPGYDETEILEQYQAFLVTRGLTQWDALDASSEHHVLHAGDTGTSLQQPWPYASVGRGKEVEQLDMELIRKEWAAADAQAAEPLQDTEFFVTVSANKGVRRLHRTVVCCSVKALCRKWEEVYFIELAQEDDRCKRCFPRPGPSEEFSSSGSSGSSSESDEPSEEIA